MIEVSRYQSGYYDVLTMLHHTQNVDLLETPETLPEIGFIATEGAITVAAGFLRCIEGGFAQIDTLVTNGDLTSDLRHEGISAVVDRIIAEAKIKGLKGLLCLTDKEDILARSATLGFKVLEQTPIVLQL